MATTDFTTGTVITSDWLNDVDAFVYDGNMTAEVLTITNDVDDQQALTINKTSSGAAFRVNKWQEDSSGAALNLNKSRGTSVNDYTIVQAGDTLGYTFFQGSNGTEFKPAAAIFGLVDSGGTPSATSMPGRLRFSTTPDGSTSLVPRMFIDKDGEVSVGTAAPTAGRSFAVEKDHSGDTNTNGIRAGGKVLSSVANSSYFLTATATEAASFTLTSLVHYNTGQGVFGAGSTVTSQIGFQATSSLSGATNNYGFYGSLAADGTNDYNFYSAGTAPNYFLGATTFGTSLGYGTKSAVGGVVTQTTSKATGVTLNKICGQITTHAAALAASTSVSFTVNNSQVAATDVVILNIQSGATASSYIATVGAVGAGSFVVHLRNISGGSLSEAIVLNFAIIKAVAS